MGRYSIDLRERVINAYEVGDRSIRQIAEAFTVHRNPAIAVKLSTKLNRHQAEQMVGVVAGDRSGFSYGYVPIP